MIPASAVFIKHRIMHAGVSPSSSRRYAVLTDRSLIRTLDYGRRVGEFAEKGGIDRSATSDDLRLGDIENTLDYGAREGRYENRKTDIPLVAGEVSGGMFDQTGIVLKCNAELAKEIKKTGSSLIDSIVTVSREYAAELDMMRKVDFQRVLRSSWADQVASWGVIDRENVRWVAEFHTDADYSVHVHVHTWDASGAFSGGKDIPYMNILPANDRVRQMVFKDKVLDKDVDKYYLRELSIAKLRLTLGQNLNENVRAKLEQLRFNSSYQAHPVSLSQNLSNTKQAAITEKTLEALKSFPPSLTGYVQFGSLTPERKEAVKNLRKQTVVLSPNLKKVIDLYRALVEQGAVFQGLKDGWKEKYVISQMSELNRRLDNVVSKHLGTMNSPFAKDLALRRELVYAQTQISQSFIRVGGRTQGKLLTSITSADTKKLSWPLYQAALRTPALKETLESLISHTEAKIRESSPDEMLGPHKQAERFVVREITPTLIRSASLSLPKQLDNRIGRDSKRMIKEAVWGNQISFSQQRMKILTPLLNDREQIVLKSSISTLRKELPKGGTASQGLSPMGIKALKSARETILKSPTIAKNLHNQALAVAISQNQDYTTSFSGVLADKIHILDQQILHEAAVGGGQRPSLLSVIAMSSLMATGQNSIESAKRKTRNRELVRNPIQDLKSLKKGQRGLHFQ